MAGANVELNVTANGNTNAVAVNGSLAVQVTGAATAITLQMQRSTRDPAGGSPNWTNVGAAISGNPSTGISLASLDARAGGWWRGVVSSLTGSPAVVSLSGDMAVASSISQPADVTLGTLTLPNASFPVGMTRADIAARFAGKTAGSQLVHIPERIRSWMTSLTIEESLFGAKPPSKSYSFPITVTGALALSAATFAPNAPAGTVIGNIANVPADGKPVWAPAGSVDNDKVAISGDAASGWKLVVGRRASASGPILGFINVDGFGSLPVSVAVAVPQPIAPASILIDNFESLNDTAGTARTAQGNGQNSGVVALSLDAAKKIQGSNGILVAQTTAANATIGVNTANAGSHDPASIDIVAFYADISDRALVSNLSLNLQRGAQTVSVSQSDVPYPGGEWVVGEASAHANYANFVAQGAGALTTSARASQSSPYGAAFTADALVKSAKGTPIFVFRYDDISQSQFDTAFQLHKKYNLPMSVNVPVDFIGLGGRWSEAMLKEAYDSGLVELNCDSTKGDTGANITDSDADRAAALASLMANHDGLVSRGFTRNNGHKQLIWANGIHSDKLATHFQNNGFQLMVSTLPGANYVKHGVGKGRAKILLSYPSVGTETYEGNWKTPMDRALRLGLLHSQHCHGVSDSGNDTRPAELEKKLQRVRAEVDAGNALCLGFGAAFSAFGGFTTNLAL